MPIVRLGKLVLRWCNSCDLPILKSKKCSICGNTTTSVNLTPPGDIRPGFNYDIELLLSIIDNQFGPGCGEQFLPLNRLIILNHAPDLDRLDEIIFHGRVQGALKFDLMRQRFKFLPRISGATRILNAISKGFVIVDSGAVKPILSGASVLSPGILDVSKNIDINDELLVLDKNHQLLGVGSAQMTHHEMIQSDHGVAVKVRWHEDINNFDLMRSTNSCYPGNRTNNNKNNRNINKNNRNINKNNRNNKNNKTSTETSVIVNQSLDLDKPIEQHFEWQQTIKANRLELEKCVNDATKFIINTKDKYDLPSVVSFSGGKDSLAVLLLTLDAGLKPDLLFINTGLEFPETLDHVKRISKKYNLDLIQGEPKTSFWTGFNYFGPPGKDFRWCCKTCKLGPTTQIIKKHYPNGVLSFIGQRRYESEQRSNKGSVWENPWVPGQIGASPIQNWSALHVWLYIFSKGSEYNELYNKGLERIGCWLCPASDMADYILVSENHPDFNKWQSNLQKYSNEQSLSPNWIKYGLWRWKKIPKGIGQLIDQNEIKIRLDSEQLRNLETQQIERDSNDILIGSKEESINQKTAGGLELLLADGFSDCKYGLSLEGMFNKKLDMARVVNMLNILGNPDYKRDEGYCQLENKLDIFPEGGIVVKGENEKQIKNRFNKLYSIVVRAMECIGCGVCIGRCENQALMFSKIEGAGKVVVQVEFCNHCGKCLGRCPVVDFSTSNSFEM